MSAESRECCAPASSRWSQSSASAGATEHPDPAVQRALARSLAEALTRLEPLVRIELLCSWASSRIDGFRLTAALVLGEPMNALGATSCLEELARDPVAEIRLAVARAARARLAGDPVRCRAVLFELSRDPEPAVACAASSGLTAAAV